MRLIDSCGTVPLFPSAVTKVCFLHCWTAATLLILSSDWMVGRGRAKRVFIRHYCMKSAATLCCVMTCHFQRNTVCTRFTFYFSFSISSFFLSVSVHLSLCLCPLNSGSHYSLFRLFLLLPWPLSIHPSSLLFDRACVLFLSQWHRVSSQGTSRDQPVQPDGSPGSCPPPWASMFPHDITTYPA